MQDTYQTTAFDVNMFAKKTGRDIRKHLYYGVDPSMLLSWLGRNAKRFREKSSNVGRINDLIQFKCFYEIKGNFGHSLQFP